MTICALADFTYPTAAPVKLPTGRLRPQQIECTPCNRRFRMFKHASPAAYGSERGCEATVIVTNFVPPPRLYDVRKLAPPRAWWMGNNGMGPVI